MHRKQRVPVSQGLEYSSKWDRENNSHQHLVPYSDRFHHKLKVEYAKFMFIEFIEYDFGMFIYFQHWYQNVACVYVMYSVKYII